MNTSSRVHWLGAGLSSGPGIRRLAAETCRLPCGTARWRRRAGRSRASTPPPRCARTTWRASRARWKPGDIVVSMLPAPMHPRHRARLPRWGRAPRHHQLHLGRHARLRQRGQAEGPAPRQRERLDPGLDTCSRTSWSPSTGRRPATMPKPALLPLLLRRLSPAAERLPLQFSRSPLGVLRALRSPARALKEGAVREVPRVWEAIESFQVTGGRRAEAFRPYRTATPCPTSASTASTLPGRCRPFVRGSRCAWAVGRRRGRTSSPRWGRSPTEEARALADQLWRAHQ